MAKVTSPLQLRIQALEDKRYQAVLDQDYDTFESLCHRKLVYSHSGGNRDSLETYMAKLRTGALRYHRIDHPVEDIVLLGDTALVIGQMTAELTINGTHKTITNSTLAVWVNDARDWKFVAYQPTPAKAS